MTSKYPNIQIYLHYMALEWWSMPPCSQSPCRYHEARALMGGDHLFPEASFHTPLSGLHGRHWAWAPGDGNVKACLREPAETSAETHMSTAKQDCLQDEIETEHREKQPQPLSRWASGRLLLWSEPLIWSGKSGGEEQSKKKDKQVLELTRSLNFTEGPKQGTHQRGGQG